MPKVKYVLLAVLPLGLLLSGCNEYKIDKRKNTPGPTSMSAPIGTNGTAAIG